MLEHKISVMIRVSSGLERAFKQLHLKFIRKQCDDEKYQVYLIKRSKVVNIGKFSGISTKPLVVAIKLNTLSIK